MRPLWRPFLIILTLSSGTSMQTAEAQSTYRLPPQIVEDIVAAQPEPSVSFSPDGKWMLLLKRDAMPGISDLARRMLRIGGLRIDPAANGIYQNDYIRGIAFRSRQSSDEQVLDFPEGTKIGGIGWSHHSNAFVYTLVTDHGTELWLATVEAPTKPIRLTDRLSTVLDAFDWMPNGKSLLCNLVPKDRGVEPTSPLAPSGPNIEESAGNKSPARTYQDLLTNPYDEQLFEYYAQSQLVEIDLQGKVREIGEPGLIDYAGPSPDGKHLLVTRMERPFSYQLPYSAFPKSIEVWDRSGKKIYTVAKVPLEENIPIEGVRTGRRSIQWRAGLDATLLWVEALDGGDPRNQVPHRDKLMNLGAPFQAEPTQVLLLQHRYAGVSFFANKDWLLVSENDRDRRWVTSRIYDLANPDDEPRVFIDRSIRDRYGDPGRLLTQSDATGYSIALQHGNWLYQAGQGATPEGFLPFLDRRDVKSLKAERLWRCQTGELESVVMITNDGPTQGQPSFVTRHESPTSPPNYYERQLTDNSKRAITNFRDPTPQIRGIKKQLVKYQRADGVPLSATLYLPEDHQPGTKLPLLVWAYPLEFNDPATAGQVAASPWQFTRMPSISHLTLVTQGYAIMDEATMPVVGDPETMNDTFIEQIVAAAKAAIDTAVEMGVADPDRVAVGGHSYGAFMTANLLAHSNLFRAGVARSGAYNRTLTPFGFQSERRPLWEAKKIYMDISPFMHAEKIQTPLLLIHGEADNNPGTFPIQSQRLYQAIKGNGGTVRLVMLPLESHGYRARESVLHTQAEMIEWLNKYVRDVAKETTN